MNIAIPVTGENITDFGDDQGHYALVEVRPTKCEILGSHRIDAPSTDPAEIAEWLAEKRIDLVIGLSATSVFQDALKERGIRVLTGVTVDTPHALVKQFMARELGQTPVQN